MAGELMNLQMESKDLEIQLMDISASIKNKYKVSKNDMQHWNIISISNDEVAQGSMRTPQSLQT